MAEEAVFPKPTRARSDGASACCAAAAGALLVEGRRPPGAIRLSQQTRRNAKRVGSAERCLREEQQPVAYTVGISSHVQDFPP
jgi:hypothetical protein